MAKIVFVLHRREDLTLEQANEIWTSEEHLSKVRKLPGLVKFVQNHVITQPGGLPCDGVGEVYFESDEAMERALQSPEMGGCVESSKTFLDMEKTALLIVRENEVDVTG